MDPKLVEGLLSTGVVGVVALLAIYAIKKLYADMTSQHNKQLEDSIKREDKLMLYLDKKNESDVKITQTLENINDEMNCLNKRMDTIETIVKKDG